MLTQDGYDLTINKGDTATLSFSGLPTDKAYTAYWAIDNEDGTKIQVELASTSYDQTIGIAYFNIVNTWSDKLPVGEFPYALKICAQVSGVTQEDTVIPMVKLVDGVYVRQEAPTITILPKKAEGAQ